MAEEDNVKDVSPSEGEEYEILPQKEISELKEELRKLKEFEITPSKKMQVSLVEVNNKLDKLLSIFEEAMTALQVEEGGLSFKEKMRPIVEKMNKILEQNSEIAQGIVAVADLVRDLREDLGKGVAVKETISAPEPMPLPGGRIAPPAMPPVAPSQPAPAVPAMPPLGLPPPPPPRRRRFGL
ncbi:MAG: hypothetical protein QXR48_04770 [Candidatus Woesearchaeota archaeon]